MKFPSIKTLADSAARTIKRFPLEVLFALVGTVATIVNIELDNINRVGENWCVRVIMMANIGLLLTLSATLYSESRGLSNSTKNVLRVAGAIVAIVVLFIINPGIRQADYIRFLLLSLSAHLLIAFAAFTAQNSVQGFWQFNKTLFLQVLTATLYSIVLALGLSAAIGAVNYLFGFNFEFDTFKILWAIIFGMFSTIFFLSGVPLDFNQLNADQSYPKGLKIFTQYVLIPLATVYVLILLAYEVKIISEWNLPKGAVSYLILSYSVFGILSLLLVYPVRDQEENKWLKTYARSFYFLMIPLLALLFAAVGVRVFRYGITEPRYFLIMLACWLLFITIYFLVAKKQNIKLIPISLCIAALLTVYGPQSAFSVAEYSQLKVATELLKKNNALKNGKAIPVKKISGRDGRRLASSIEYLVEHHDLTSLQPLFNEDLDKIADSISKKKSGYYKGLSINRYEFRFQKLDWVRKKLNINDVYKYDDNAKIAVYEADNEEPEYTFYTPNKILQVTGYNLIMPMQTYSTGAATDTMGVIAGIRYKYDDKRLETYSITLNGEKFTFNATAMAGKLIALAEKSGKKFEVPEDSDIETYPPMKKYILPTDSLTIKKEGVKFTVTMALQRVTCTKRADTVAISYWDASYLVKKKE